MTAATTDNPLPGISPERQAELHDLASQARFQAAADTAGGAEARDEILDWARDSLTQPEIADYDRRLADPSRAGHAFDELMYRRRQARHQTLSQASVAAGGFASLDALRDAGGHTAEIQAKLTATPRQLIVGANV